MPTGRIIGTCVTNSLALFLTLPLHRPIFTSMSVTQLLPRSPPPLYSYNMGCYPIGYANREGYPMARAPAGSGTPIDRRYPSRFYPNPNFAIYTTLSDPIRLGIYPNPTYPIYRIVSSSLCRMTQWVILNLPVLRILPCPRFYRVAVYPNPTYSIYHTICYRILTGGEFNGSDNRLADWRPSGFNIPYTPPT